MSCGIRIEKEGKALQLYKRKGCTAVLTFFIPTEKWWEELKKDFKDIKIYINGYYEAEMAIIFIYERVGEVYDKIINEKWYEDGEAME